MVVVVGGKITIAPPEGGDTGMSRTVGAGVGAGAGAGVGVGAFVVVEPDPPEMEGGGTTIGPEP